MTTLTAPRRPDVYTVALLDAAIAAPTRHVLAKADVQTGAMIALVPAPQDATRLAVQGGEATSELHLTLWYLGEAATYDEETRTGLVTAITSMVERRSLPLIKARVFGANLWNPDSDSPAWVYAVGDLPEGERPDGQETLGAFRSAMSDAWHSGGLVIDLPPQHSPWAPHVCSEYSNNPARLAEMTDRLGPVTLDRIRVAFAGEHTDIPLTAAPTSLPGEPAMGPTNAAAVVTEAVEDKYDPNQPRRSDGTWGDDGLDLPDLGGDGDHSGSGNGGSDSGGSGLPAAYTDTYGEVLYEDSGPSGVGAVVTDRRSLHLAVGDKNRYVLTELTQGQARGLQETFREAFDTEPGYVLTDPDTGIDIAVLGDDQYSLRMPDGRAFHLDDKDGANDLSILAEALGTAADEHEERFGTGAASLVGRTLGPVADPKVDKLRLSRRMPVGEGERVVSSRRLPTGDNSETEVPAAVMDTPAGREMRIGFPTNGDAKSWTGENDGTTVRLDRDGLTQLRAEISQHAKDAKARQKTFLQNWERLDDLDAELAHPDLDGGERQTLQAERDELQAWSDGVGVDDMLAEGVIPGTGGWGDLAYQVHGWDDGEAGWYMNLARKPDGGEPNWEYAAQFESTNVTQLLRALAAMDEASTTASAGTDALGTFPDGLLPIRAFTTDRGYRMGGRTAARAERTRLRVDSKRKWFRIENKSSGTDVYLYGEIGCWGVSASDFAAELRTVNAQTINLHINSPGGEVFDGVAIYNALKTHPAYVKTTVDGIAASAASFIAMAGDEIKVMRHAQMMIHEASSGAYGNSTDLQKQADLLDRLSATIADIYAQRAGGSPDAWRELMRVETWFNAEEAKKAGLADEIGGDVPDEPARPTKATWDLSVFNFAGRDNAPPPALQPVALADDPGDTGGEQGTTDVEPSAVVDTDTEAAVEPEGAVVEDATPAVEPATEAPAGPAAQTTPEPAGQPLAWAAPVWATTPADPWHSLVAGLTNPAPSTSEGATPTAQEAIK